MGIDSVRESWPDTGGNGLDLQRVMTFQPSERVPNRQTALYKHVPPNSTHLSTLAPRFKRRRAHSAMAQHHVFEVRDLPKQQFFLSLPMSQLQV